MNTIKQKMKKVIYDESGLGTIEVVIILAVLVGLAFLFHTFAKGLFTDISNGIKNKTNVDSLFSYLWIYGKSGLWII